MKKIVYILLLLVSVNSLAQKKILDHSVYDAWQTIGERNISNDGKYLFYAINPQEGDGVLYVKNTAGDYSIEIPRGYGAIITEDSKFLICKIKPGFSEAKEAKIKKRKPEDSPKDSLLILKLGSKNLKKIPRVKSFKLPDEGIQFLAYLLEKPLVSVNRNRVELDSSARIKGMISMADSLARIADSIKQKANEVILSGFGVLKTNPVTPSPNKPMEEPVEEGTELKLLNLHTDEEKAYSLVSEYYFNKFGNSLVIESTKKNGNPQSKNAIHLIEIPSLVSKFILAGYNDAKGYKLDEPGKQIAFIIEKDSSSKSLQRFYQLYYYQQGMDSAIKVADRFTKGIPKNWTISDFPAIGFSKSGNRLFVGTSKILPIKDTSLPELDRVNLDIWHYNDDYIQTVQLKNMTEDMQKSFPALVDIQNQNLVQLVNEQFRGLIQTNEGDGNIFYAINDAGKRVATQWQGFSLNDIYAINPANGQSTKILANFKGNLIQASPSGKYLLLFDERLGKYQIYHPATKKMYPIAKDIPFSLVDEENDMPDDANAYGAAKWVENDQWVLIYDRYDIWKVDPTGTLPSICITKGRKLKQEFRYLHTNPDEKYVKSDQQLLLKIFDHQDKSSGLAFLDFKTLNVKLLFKEAVAMNGNILKAKQADQLLYTKESYEQSPNIFVQNVQGNPFKLSNTNPQQANYHWGTTQLFQWKAYTGKVAEGIIYQPANFDPAKKYPMIVYFYDRSSNTLNNYIPPAPTPSRLNISFFVSRGYVVFVPDIWYQIGKPGKSAYDYILSGTRAVVKLGYVDSTKIGLQGQSWGGYQIVHLITKTKLYAAAWAGAPVANMTSAYGGIRWGTGLLRQMQYEKQQSRIGGTLWEKTQAYIDNSALFSLPSVTTPLVIMANDADDAVPWYQGIEMYAGMRRLGKKVWMLNYNGEAHNLMERKNRKDIQIREQQFFDYLLKGEKPAKWISEGVPAILKGRDLGLGN